MTSNNSELFSVIDPLGINVVLNNERFNNHIKVRHKEVSPELIKETVEKPNYIILNRNNCSTKQDYYSVYSKYSNKDLYSKVVVELDEAETSGNVITAHLTNKVDAPQSDWIVWPKN